ncbi:MAG TPA: anti-sigma factor [Acidobacteriaceae bacterium]|nr:anti-sigma factor [Acidobacteriaceae bacterium]
MTPDLHPDMDDLVLFCLGTPAGEPESKENAAVMERVREHLRRCPKCSAEAAQLHADLALVAMSAPQVAPPPAAKERLMRAAGISASSGTTKSASLKTFPAPIPEVPASRGVTAVRAKRTNPALVWGGWVAALACLVYAIHGRDVNQDMEHRLMIETAQLHQTDAAAERAREVVEVLTSPESQRVALVSVHAQPQPSGAAVYLKSRGALVFTASNLVRLPAKKTYELWVIPANGGAPIPAGIFRPDAQGMASVLLPHLPKGVQAKAFGVTMENAGGSTTPTLPILLAGG